MLKLASLLLLALLGASLAGATGPGLSHWQLCQEMLTNYQEAKRRHLNKLCEIASTVPWTSIAPEHLQGRYLSSAKEYVAKNCSNHLFVDRKETRRIASTQVFYQTYDELGRWLLENFTPSWNGRMSRDQIDVIVQRRISVRVETSDVANLTVKHSKLRTDYHRRCVKSGDQEHEFAEKQNRMMAECARAFLKKFAEELPAQRTSLFAPGPQPAPWGKPRGNDAFADPHAGPRHDGTGWDD